MDGEEWDQALGLARWEDSPVARTAHGMLVTVSRGGDEAVYRIEDIEFGADGGEAYTLVRVKPEEAATV